MTLQEYNDLYKMPLLKSMTITTSGGITITNANIVSENMSLEKSLCSETNLRYGRCEAACFTIRIADLNHDFTGEWLNVIQDVVTDSEGYLLTQNGDYLLTKDGYRIKLKDEEIDEATAPYGRFKVYSDKPENDRRWRVLTCYDQMYDILNADVLAWYNTLTFPMTIKNLRDSFFSYLGITQVSRTLVNDSFSTPGGFAVSGELSGKTVIESICELNGVFGQMTADGKFDYVSLPDAEELTFDYYVDGTGSYEDYVTDVITGINIKGTANDVGITVGTTDNLYVISSNPLVYGTEGTTALTNALTALLNQISADSFRPFKVTTYGNPMLPLGTKVTLNTKNKTIVSYVIKKNLTGIQNLKDEVSATGEKHQPTNVNSPKSEIFRTQGKVHELEINVDGLTSRVAATETNLADNYSTTTQTESMISQSATDITTAVSQNYVTQSAYNAEVQNLQDQIDGRIEYWDGNVVPTLNNPPANSWTTTATKDSHIGDLYRYHHGTPEVTDYYRFDKDTSTTPATYSWVVLGESQVDEALRQAELANQKADAAQAQLNALQQDVEDNYYTKAQTNSAINQSAAAITQSVSSTYETKSDSTSKFNTANTNAQGYANDAKNAANAATDNKLQSYYTKAETNSQIQQTANSITQSVSATYTTKEEFGDLQIGGTNLLTLTKTLGSSWGKQDATVENGVATIEIGTLSEHRIYQVPSSGGWAWQPNTKYVASIEARSVSDTGKLRIWSNANSQYKDFDLTSDWARYTFEFTTSSTVGTGSLSFYDQGTDSIQVRLPKLEYGDKATAWSPSPTDTDIEFQNYYTKTETNSQIEQTATSITQTVEENYTSKLEFENLSIGGANLLRTTKTYEGWYQDSGVTYVDDDNYSYASIVGSSGNWIGVRTRLLSVDLLNGSTFMLSFEYSSNADVSAVLIAGGCAISDLNVVDNPQTRTKYCNFAANQTLPSTSNSWKKISILSNELTLDSFTSGSGDVNSWFLQIYNRSNTTVKIRKMKLEYGNKATDWSPSPQDEQDYVDFMQIGGTNILYLTETLATPWGKENATVTDGVATISGSGTGDKRIYQVPNTTSGWEWKPNTKYVVSIDAKALGTSTLRIIINGSGGIYKDFPLSTTWERYVYTFTTAATVTSGSITFSNRGSNNIQVKLPKLEYGDKATDWSPAPRDMASKSEIQQLSNKIALKVNSQGRMVTAALGVDPASSTSYFSVKADDISFISNGNITLATGSTGRIGIDSTNFKVNKDTGNVSVTGAITATSLTLSGNASVPSSKVSGLSTVATTGQASDISGLAAVATTGSYSSLSGKPDLTVYVAKDGTIGTVEEGSTGFVVSSQGLLQASNAIIYGTIYAGSGTIGGWGINSTKLTSEATSGTNTYTVNLQKYGDDPVNTNAIEVIKNENGARSYPFAVKYDGRLIARSATIEGSVTSGDLTATGGTIGGLEIDTTGIFYQASASSYSGISSTVWPIFANASSKTNLAAGRFRVNSVGGLFASGLNLTGDSGDVTDISDRYRISMQSYLGSGGSTFRMYDSSGNSEFSVTSSTVTVAGNFRVYGTKNRVVKTENYGERLLYCYETPAPMFGDIGEGKIAEDGKCYVWLDSTFSETIKTESYQVFLQNYGHGECYITERTPRYFVVEGDVGMSFGWEVKARQIGFENERLESFIEQEEPKESYNYPLEAIRHLEAIQNEREVA